MLDFFGHAGRLTIAICSALVILSVVVKNFCAVTSVRMAH
jgi:hypothetical protein